MSRSPREFLKEGFVPQGGFVWRKFSSVPSGSGDLIVSLEEAGSLGGHWVESCRAFLGLRLGLAVTSRPILGVKCF